MSRSRPEPTSTTAVTNRWRVRRDADNITVSSKPTISAGPILVGVWTRSPPMRSTADHTVDQDRPKPRAIDAGVPSKASTRSVAHSAALVVSTRRGSPARPARSRC
jgi:hypothetical protein